MIEIYGSSRPRDGGKPNEDAFLIHRSPIPFAALCDGAGKVELSAKRALSFFEKLFIEANRDDIERFSTWIQWAKLLDSSLLGGNQSTFIAIAVLEEQYVGTCVGDSRVYLRDTEGQIHIVGEDTVKYRLGSGNVDPVPIYIPSKHGELVLLMSAGAWTPLTIPDLKKVINKKLFGHLSELSPAILDEAGKNGRADDMTVIAMKRTR